MEDWATLSEVAEWLELQLPTPEEIEAAAQERAREEQRRARELAAKKKQAEIAQRR